MSQRRGTTKKRRLALSATLIVVVAFLIVVVRLVEDIGPERRPGDRFIVAKVLDGDTVELAGGDRLRLLAIDTPEEGERYHDEAAGLLERLALGRTATIEYASKRRDRYGRLLGYLYIDSAFINRTLIDSGLAYVYLFKDNKLDSPRIAALLEAQRGAIDRSVGLWSIEREPEDYYLSPPGSFRLHRPGCRSVRNCDRHPCREFSTREEGLVTGLSPCRNCKP